MLAWLLVLPRVLDHMFVDGVSYLDIAEHYLAGRWDVAVNAYWSPLWSWLAVPVLATGADHFLTARVLGLFSALLTLLVVHRWLLRLGVDAGAAGIVLAGGLPFLLAASVLASPDLLLVAILLTHLDLATRADAWRPRTAALAGALAGSAYLTKLFALPFLVVMVPLLVGLQVWRDPARTRTWVRAGVVQFGVFLAVVAAWASVLSIDLGRPSVGTAAEVNLETTAEGSHGTPMIHGGLTEPPHATSSSPWEDPARLNQHPGRTARTDRADATPPGTQPVTRAPARPEPRAGMVGVVEARLRAVGVNLQRAGDELRRWRFFVPVALLAQLPLWWRARPRDLGLVALPVASAVYLGGLLAIHLDERYAWFALLALLPGATAGAVTTGHRLWGRGLGREWDLGVMRRRPYRWVLVAVIACTLLWPGLRYLTATIRSAPHAAPLARELEPDLLDGREVASDSDWIATMQLCAHAGCRYHGITGPGLHADWRRQLATHRIDVYLVWDPTNLPPGVGARVYTATSAGGVQHQLHVVDTRTLPAG
ncbi:hypothetical protein GCM10011354_14220 [Egicoccus halophilus]|uniref:Dolichyl-phosphate-mannose-protein mannosyltransferase n=2 Tax=Egicoccus halophilus TaxID=1670830 RepID=A0A8J3EUA1_9ACTN|nr:hypothetical protein GCM10011354_14220 [Egicoccus halophilus]